MFDLWQFAGGDMLEQVGNRGLHRIGERRRVQTHGDHGNGQHQEQAEFAAVHVSQFIDMVVADRAVSPARRRFPASRNSFDQL